MFSTQKIYDNYNEIIDYIFDCLEERNKYNYEELREKSLKILKEIRKDIGINMDEIKYNGSR